LNLKREDLSAAVRHAFRPLKRHRLEAQRAGDLKSAYRSTSHEYAMGEDVFTIGYPMSRLLGKSARMTKGVVSATSGMHDDPKQVQISAEIQPGNSGGPVLDHDGQILGVIQQTINPWRVAISSGGALPQNVNFSLKTVTALEFLKGANTSAYEAVRFDQAGGLAAAAHAVARVQTGSTADESDQAGRLIVVLGYTSDWNIGYRLPTFGLTVADYDALEPLFAVYDEGMASEEDAIKDTLESFRKTIASF
jgi:serine protease Do